MTVPSVDTRKKNALTKESEYGVLGIKTPLLDVSAKAEEVWGPALGDREKENSLKLMSATVEQYKQYYEVNAGITAAIRRRDYESIVEGYTKAKRFAEEANVLVQRLGPDAPTDPQIQMVLLAARVWADAEEQIDAFKRDVWKRLETVTSHSRIKFVGTEEDHHMELISILLELGVDKNPICVWLESRYDSLRNKIQTTSDHSKVDIEVHRRRLATGEQPTAHLIASHLRSLGRQTGEGKATSADSAEVIEVWEMMLSFLTSILSPQGILGEVIDFWYVVKGFIDGQTQKNLPKGFNNESLVHHRLTEEAIGGFQEGTIELIDMIRESVYELFVDPPIEDISSMFSPFPTTPKTPLPGSLTPTGLRDPRFNYDANNLPPPSPKRGEAWEKFAFWPPWSNSVSGVHYLAKFLALVGSGASEMANISPVNQGDGEALERLKNLVGSSRDRCVNAILAAWNKDAENIKVVEDWRRSPEKRDLTRMPSHFGAFESAILSGMQKILYISEATNKPGNEVIEAPPPKLLQMVRSQFVTTLYKALSGMVENAEKDVKKAEDDWTSEADGLASPVSTVIATSIGSGTVDASDRVSESGSE